MPEARARATTPWLVKNVINPIMLLTGGVPTLTVQGRITGKPIRVAVNVVELGGAPHLVSPRGETNWSRNLRANPMCALKVKGVEQRYRATEVEPSQRAPVIDAYLQRWAAQVGKEF